MAFRGRMAHRVQAAVCQKIYLKFFCERKDGKDILIYVLPNLLELVYFNERYTHLHNIECPLSKTATFWIFMFFTLER